jgi:hypothetical protein
MTEVYRPIDVLDKQAQMVRWWKTSQYRHSFADAFGYAVQKYRSTMGESVDTFIASRLNDAETFYVRSNIIDRLWHFTDVYETHGHETIEYQDLPCPRGFIFLERPIHMIDARGRVCSIKIILWSEERGGVSIVEFSDAKDPLDEINHLDRLKTGKPTSDITEYPLFHIMPWAWGKKVRNLTVADFSEDQPGVPEDTEADRQTIRDNMPTSVQSMDRFNGFLLSLWEFVQEQVPYRMRADRYMLKRLQRAHSPISEVTVVDLRPVDQPPKHTDPDHVPETVLWSHRWRVREHKRRWIDKHGNYRETTVSACVKGPEYLPLIEKDRVYHVKR